MKPATQVERSNREGKPILPALGGKELGLKGMGNFCESTLKDRNM
jgi:hypothetical protein